MDDFVRVEFAGIGKLTARSVDYFIGIFDSPKRMVFQPLRGGWFV